MWTYGEKVGVYRSDGSTSGTRSRPLLARSCSSTWPIIEALANWFPMSRSGPRTSVSPFKNPLTWMLNGPTQTLLEELKVNPRCLSACLNASGVTPLSYQRVVWHRNDLLGYRFVRQHETDVM